ncbi:MAG TPA: lipoyl(octanoyl) transferase LipB [Syntrophomonadaceae bacterium]|jgi:lipoate-protein ligase B|nr:lipoyl(octanoyl) transferase LipB [Syntrophomonadaceae bacterium]HOQ10201.1 lipoyl(octanoyl) transferase LipB [Syntrophomonadaceae bacterium]HPU49328.1 lipoyl(octanoyl) transferase LipB [Syntrophomonadaceae bacterium]
MSGHGYCLELGLEEYDTALRLQHSLNAARRQGIIPDTVIFLEHHPCFTVGRKGGFEHILADDEQLNQQGIAVYETDRGGDVTYHGPGQLICYPIIDLNDYGCDVHAYARRLEEVIIRTLKHYGITAGRKPGYPGVWVGSAKIAQEGIGVQNWVTMHGVSLNVCPKMQHFSLIIPCGISNYGVTSMEQLLDHPVDIAAVRQEMRRQFSEVFDLLLEDVDPEDLRRMANEAG